MKIHSAITGLTEILLIAAMGAIGAYAFLASSVYETVKSFGTEHRVGFLPYLPLIIWFCLAGFGFLNIILFRRGAGAFTWLVAIFSLPSLLAHNTMDWWKITGLEKTLTTTLGFNGTLILGVLTITGYVILNYLRFFKETESNMTKRRADRTDIEDVNGFSNMALLMAIGGTLAATAIIASLARGLENLVLGAVQKLPLYTVFIGLAGILLVAFYLYWLSARRRGKTDTNNRPPDSNR